jgi:hypothetical protein
VAQEVIGSSMRKTDNTPLPRRTYQALADALDDTPETVISWHVLTLELCKAWVAGEVTKFKAAIVQCDSLPSEPTGFGADADALFGLLQHVQGWDCIDVPSTIAPQLGKIIQERMGHAVRYYQDVYHVLRQPANVFEHDAVRLLTPADEHLLAAAPKELRGAGWGSIGNMLANGIAAGAIVDGQIVAIAQTCAHSPRHADIGVFTHVNHRREGLSAAVASLVARQVQQTGRAPVWSTGEDNHASLGVAAKLGFAETSRTTYVILNQ